MGDFVAQPLHIKQIDNLKKFETKYDQKNFESAEKFKLKLHTKNSESGNAIPLLETKNDCPSEKNKVGSKNW